ncbi:MAG TPA: methionyl-tRNA formyltransferase [Actinomycetes bacterium]|nr:methionyl-tRNA formyltransferase [Actinomycetes bacterium]
MRLVFAGTPDAAVPSLATLLGSHHEVVAVVSRPDAPAGRGRQLTPSPVAALTREREIELLQPRRVRDEGFLDRLRELAPDCIPVVAFGALVPAAALTIPRHGWVNVHFSLLPAWRGAAPVQHAVLHGDSLTGASTFALDEGLDTGPVYGSVTEPIATTDTSGEVLARLSQSGAKLLLRTLDGIESGEAQPVPQASAGVSLAPKLTTDDARVDWSAPALHIDRLVRACSPAPGAWTTFRGERLKLHSLRLMVEGGGQRPGELPVGELPAGELSAGELRVDKSHVLVGTGSYELQIDQVQPQGKRAMSGPDWVRGARAVTGDRLQ